ncbi:putative galE1 protein [Collimonas arenae]|nr:putative galE1 protein [Collimonas arenae]
MDVADAHISALRYLFSYRCGFTVNLGTGGGYSVLKMPSAFEEASAHRISHKIRPRPTADTVICHADPTQAAAGSDHRAGNARTRSMVMPHETASRSIPGGAGNLPQ